ncbi:heparinase II/III family protein [Litorimonas sp. RW-G-Af-16]|uniref:heparinase II/III domain-containing protein n=1 Tax=Litorimonas sp. RW-G-Af-16 TaxID=3241168 RepID=UPI00390C81B3
MRLLANLLLGGALLSGFVACSPASQSSTGGVDAPYFGPTFADTQAQAEARIKAQMALPITVPTPKDAGGGYTHEQHKNNAKLIYDASMLYKLTGEAAYADFAAQLLTAYADVYPNWGEHPAKKEQSPGRMFWQNLNESWWLVNVIQGYDAVKDTLTPALRDHIETDLLRNMADFLSEGSPETFDKIHNHGTWATAAVGMTGYVIGDKEYSDKALLGLDKSGERGFIKQLDELFSPDGYYNEGPYYQRYALMPFVLFGQAIEANEPEREIFKYRDGILKKAIYSTVHQSYNGLFFPINDALKDKGIATTELLYGVSIAYDLTGDPTLLSVAEAQGKFVLTPESRAVSEALIAGKAEPFEFASMRLSDGKNGDEGALDIMRSSSDPKAQALIMKNTSQGLGHGHFDKMGILYYNNGQEVLRDYGAARFLNIEAKYGGHYLPENNAFAKQTIAHNALVVDQESHFGGSTSLGNKHHPKIGVFEISPNLTVSSAEIDTAYPDVRLGRTVAMISDSALPKPVIVDLMEAHSDNVHQYDLPFYYNGQLIDTNFELAADRTSRSLLGEGNGYEFLWKVAEAEPVDGLAQMTWLLDRQFYTITSSTPKSGTVIFAEIGANDPNFNLRREPAMIFRAEQGDGVSYLSVIEPHGEYNPTVEFTVDSYSAIAKVEHFEADANEFVQITLKTGEVIGLAMAGDQADAKQHSANFNNKTYEWTGAYRLFSSEEMK